MTFTSLPSHGVLGGLSGYTLPAPIMPRDEGQKGRDTLADCAMCAIARRE